MATYECTKCGMSVNATCGKCNAPLVDGNLKLDNGNSVVATDIKPKEYWFQDFDTVENHYSTDMKDISNCRKVTQGVDYVFNNSLQACQ